jgi:5-oxopent-3-ene-1,2,5-tricarboxylate decarboxylase / 2-hydroxyhepta-2,4-diene-1,7-dioate isomerase
LTLEVHINGVLQQTVDLQTMRRLLPQLLTDVGAFTPLQAGDVLMLGLDVCDQGPEAGHRPHARAGDVIDIRAPQCAALGHLRNSLVQEAA